MQSGAAVRFSWDEPEPAFGFQGSPAASEGDSAQARGLGGNAAQHRRAANAGSRPAVRVRRPPAGPTATAHRPTSQHPAQAAAAQTVEQQPSVPATFAFGTPGTGASSSTEKARRAKGRTPASGGRAAGSPGFTASSGATGMAWSPYPGSSDAEASTPFGGIAPAAASAREAPDSSTATSAAPVPAASPGPATVAEDLQARLNLSGPAEAEREGGSASNEADSLSEALRQQLNFAGQPHAAAQAAVQGAAAPEPAAGSSWGFSFVFGTQASVAAAEAAAGSPLAGTAGRAAVRKKSPGSSPALRSPSATHAPSAATAAAATAAEAAQPSARAFQPAVAPSFQAAAAAATQVGPAAAATGASGTTRAGQEQGAAPVAASAPPPTSFIFGSSAASSSNAPVGHRHRHRPSSRRTAPAPAFFPPAAPVAVPAAASAGVPPPRQQPMAASAAAAEPEPLQENQQPQQSAWYVRLGDLGKPAAAAAAAAAAVGGGGTVADSQQQAAGSSSFHAAGSAARRMPRRKGVHPSRSSPVAAAAVTGTRSRAAWQAAEAATAPPLPPPLAPSPRNGALDEASQSAYSRSEMYRSQGNEAFRDGTYEVAHELYTKALHALWPHPSLHPRLALLLSNRAAALLSQGKPLSALADCQMGLKYDPSLLRCALRVATCHSRLGDFDEAFRCVGGLRDQVAGDAERTADVVAKQKDLEEQERQMYNALRSLGHAVQPPKRDPSTGVPLQRVPSAGASLSRAASGSCAAVAAPSTAEALWEALKKVDEVAPHVPHSELLHAAKAEALLRLGRLEKAREFCEQQLHLDEGSSQQQRQKGAPWRLWVQVQCSWQEGDTAGSLKQQLTDLQAGLQQAAKQQQAAAAGAASGDASAATAASAFFPAAAAAAAAAGGPSQQERRLQEQLALVVGLPSCADAKALLVSLETADTLRVAGNAAVKAGKASEAVQKYSEALAVGSLSPIIAAVLLSNRAAAHQHLKQLAQAVADCSRAVALNPQYVKAHSRLATLLADLGRHEDAVTALEAASGCKEVSSADRRAYQQRLATEKAAARRAAARVGHSGQAAIDHYKLLGLERSVATEAVRRAYKKLALQLHPDKAASACRVAPRCCGCGSAAFESLAAVERLQDRATWLFKLLGEASEVLADPAKRRELDLSLAMWAGGGAASRGPAGGFGNYSSYYNQQDDDEEDFASYFSSMFGRRYGGSSGYSGSARRGAPTGTRQQYSSYGRNY